MIDVKDVSVIIPALLPNDDFLRCVYSIRTAFVGRVNYEIICVVPDVNPFFKYTNLDVAFIKEVELGIYGAMNLGIKKATGRYLYFVGQDDILLPSSTKAISEGLERGADLILADVFWGAGRVFKNSSSRNSLVWKNWCHQGLFYDRLKFMNSVGEYPVRFKVQSDHYANIVFSSAANLKIFKYNGCIAWYSSDGFSSRFVDSEFRGVFPGLVLKYFGFIPYFIVVVRRAILKIFRFIRKVK